MTIFFLSLWLLLHNQHYKDIAECSQQRPAGPQSLKYLTFGPLKKMFADLWAAGQILSWKTFKREVENQN